MTMKQFITSLFVLAAAALPASARLVEGRSFRQLNQTADIIAVARPVFTTDTAEETNLPNLSPPTQVVGLSTKFDVELILKGDRRLTNLMVHHYRLKDNKQLMHDGPNLASFDLSASARYLLFLKHEPDGRYAPINQIDPLVTSILRLSGPRWSQMKPDDFRKWLDAMKWLNQSPISLGPNFSPEIPPGGTGEGSLHEAAFNGKLEKARALIKEHPALVNSQDSYAHQTPLHLAVQYGHKDIAELLLTNNADVEARAYGNWTPLLNAVFGGHQDLVELLLAHKAEVNVREDTGRTPLQVAAENGYTGIAAVLLAHQADINAPTHDGLTPLHTATALGFKDLVVLLLANHADVNAKDTHGRTPLGYALLHKNNELAELLRQHGGLE